jgi:biopolymer transport protein ExbD
MRLGRPDSRLDPAQLRLPLIALIDVVLFLLLYFMFSGALDSEERELAAALRTEGGGAGAAMDLQPQVINIERIEGREAYRMGQRVFLERETLFDAIRDLPKEVGVVLRVADQVSVGTVASATQVCHDAGFDKISYVPAKPAVK